MIRYIVSLLRSGLSVLFGYLYYSQYHKWRNCFDETGRCFDPQTGVVYLEQSWIGWIVLALLALAGVSLWVFFTRTKK